MTAIRARLEHIWRNALDQAGRHEEGSFPLPLELARCEQRVLEEGWQVFDEARETAARLAEEK